MTSMPMVSQGAPPIGDVATSPNSPDPLSALRGASCAARRFRGELAQAAASEATVLLMGETGTGKGLAARALHRASVRRARPFVHVDCASLSPHLIESELFGHERGAFTGAVERRVGRFELAADSTLFLDEIGELEGTLQAKLLRVLEDREFERVGGGKTLRMSARVIAATHRDLQEEVGTGWFRADLYFRLCVLPIRVPPLRERLQDLPVLVDHILEELGERRGRAVVLPAPGFLVPMLAYTWPGNVRELIHVLERLLVRCPENAMTAEHVAGVLGDAPGFLGVRGALREGPVEGPATTRAFEGPSAAETPLEGREEEARRIAGALLASGGNVARAARRLQMPRSTLRYRVEVLGLEGLIPRD